MAVLAIMWVFLSSLGLIVYFIPTIIAAVRHHRRVAAIGLLNFLAGWSVLGWVAALVWALVTE